MEKVYGYIRVSTAKQGKGVSLVEQKDAIDAYAKRHNLTIVKWFEELETAAKRGRPVFSEMMKLLKNGKADGVIMHKIDRSARNMRDWSELTELADNNGVQVHFVQESVNLLRDNDRLSADMQAVVASHYIRNLRQETIKGLYGRLKQGVYPFQAPLGYLDTGAGNPKKIDPEKDFLVKKIFTLYLTEQWGVIDLAECMNKLGLKNTRGGLITKNTISKILNNPFYAGIMKVAGQTFPGKHKPLISIRDFETVQSILSGKTPSRSQKHDFIYSKVLKCSGCDRSLIGEVQKGIHYYRCHTKTCPVKCLREDYFESNLLGLFKKIELSENDTCIITRFVEEQLIEKNIRRQKEKSSIDLQKSQVQSRIDNLLDLLVDGVIDKEIYNRKHEKLLFRLQELKEKRIQFKEGNKFYKERLEEFIELTNNLISSYKIASKEKKRYMVKKITSNRLISPKNVDIQLFPMFAELSKRTKLVSGGPVRDDFRHTDSDSANKSVIKKDTVNQKRIKKVKVANERILKKVANHFLSEVLKNSTP